MDAPERTRFAAAIDFNESNQQVGKIVVTV
jgi:hypothetical protein